MPRDHFCLRSLPGTGRAKENKSLLQTAALILTFSLGEKELRA